MNILQSLNGAAAVLRGATGLVRELRRPKAADAAFAALLQAQLQRNDPAAAQRSAEAITKQSERFISLRDADRDGRLTLEESGLTQEAFAKLDIDGDGALTAAEVAKPALNALQNAQTRR
ncbi:MAG: hypothetical protein KA184_00585 [Candidatus Hydrogenedentes bacterium]|nr:hypothetical protein [Candidatus Hydrogenedentota bacterium]